MPAAAVTKSSVTPVICICGCHGEVIEFSRGVREGAGVCLHEGGARCRPLHENEKACPLRSAAEKISAHFLPAGCNDVLEKLLGSAV